MHFYQNSHTTSKSNERTSDKLERLGWNGSHFIKLRTTQAFSAIAHFTCQVSLCFFQRNLIPKLARQQCLGRHHEDYARRGAATLDELFSGSWEICTVTVAGFRIL